MLKVVDKGVNERIKTFIKGYEKRLAILSETELKSEWEKVVNELRGTSIPVKKVSERLSSSSVVFR